MATIKPIEGKSIHQIQSGQVIVDLCSVVKELVENSLDADATSIDVRFKNYGLDAIEILDNGSGISPEDFESIALKHYTSKLSTYDDLTSLHTFGFRGEALSSLCALSNLHIVTARDVDAPKGTRLEFEQSGKLRAKSVVASQKGTAVVVENIFKNLPVRRKELEKNIKREYRKVLELLHAYACISVGIRFSVSNQALKGKKITAFSTHANATTKENISNVYGAKTLPALLPLNMKLELQPGLLPNRSGRNWNTENDPESRQVLVTGHISRPVVGEGRQTPDRQMFFVNSRPCTLPQVAKAINEVYKSYNVTQSPFILVNLQMDTNAYDVNVSPDKKTILLHDQTSLLESLKASMIEVFESHDQTVPQAQLSNNKKSSAYPTMDKIIRVSTNARENIGDFGRKSPQSGQENDIARRRDENSDCEDLPPDERPATSLLQNLIEQSTVDRDIADKTRARKHQLSKNGNKPQPIQEQTNTEDGLETQQASVPPPESSNTRGIVSTPRAVQDTTSEHGNLEESEIPSVSPMAKKRAPGLVQNAFDRMRPKRIPMETATITIGNKTTTMTLGTPEAKRRRIHTPKFSLNSKQLSGSSPLFIKSLQAYTAPGTQLDENGGCSDNSNDEVDVPVDSNQPVTTSSMDQTEDSDMLDLNDPTSRPTLSSTLFLPSDDDSGDEYIDEAKKKEREEAKIAKMIAQAEEALARPTSDNLKRAAAALKGKVRRDSTLQLIQHLETSLTSMHRKLACLIDALKEQDQSKNSMTEQSETAPMDDSAEERLSLTVSKSDFARMRIVGQFNLGFILASRQAASEGKIALNGPLERVSDELFIIDQHASDEKYNFERLQAETIVQNQRLVHPRKLELTAVEEEIILNLPDALVKNGFTVETDESGEQPVGQRCRLISIPMSKGVVFGTRDLEELLALLSERTGSEIPRPTKVRRMFAMRACRSSIMVGKNLTHKQMEKVVRHMGELDKPWNCPHGRPTMRHLFGLGDWQGWSEGDGLTGMGDQSGTKADWAAFVARSKANELLGKSVKGRRLASTAK